MLQDQTALEKLYETKDPWGYQGNPHDLRRRSELLALLPRSTPQRTLDIGCGDGFVTFSLPGAQVVGVDISSNAIQLANAELTSRGDKERFLFLTGSIFDLGEMFPENSFDLIVITGVLYPQYIAGAKSVVRLIIDKLLVPNGTLACCHVAEWYQSFFWYTKIDQMVYPYREYMHLLEVSKK